jgi:hypothetical protein
MNSKTESNDVWPGDPKTDEEYWDALGRACRQAYIFEVLANSCIEGSILNQYGWRDLPKYVRKAWIEAAKKVKSL